MVALCIVLGCQKQRAKPQPAVQAPPNVPEQSTNTAELAFREGRCAEAVAEYTQYLESNPAAPDTDAVLFRVAVCRLLPQSTAYGPDEALRILKDLTARFPASSWRPHAELILSLSAHAGEQVAELEQLNARIRGLSDELEKVRNAEKQTRTQLQQVDVAAAKERHEKDARIRQLTATVEELEERIRRLSEELEALKKIDLQRRPSRPRP